MESDCLRKLDVKISTHTLDAIAKVLATESITEKYHAKMRLGFHDARILEHIHKA